MSWPTSIPLLYGKDDRALLPPPVSNPMVLTEALSQSIVERAVATRLLPAALSYIQRTVAFWLEDQIWHPPHGFRCRTARVASSPFSLATTGVLQAAVARQSLMKARWATDSNITGTRLTERVSTETLSVRRI